MRRRLHVFLLILAFTVAVVPPPSRAETEREREEEERRERAAEAERKKRPPETPAQAVRSLVDAERKFFQAGQEHGTRAAFLGFLADNGIVFRPGPVNGRRTWEQRPETGFDLVWEPVFAAIARSADFGYDTGPAKWRANRKEKEFSGYGHFISIWRKGMDGAWKVELDCGIENPKPSRKPESLRTLVPKEQSGLQPDATSRQKAFGQAQKDFIAAAKLNLTKALREFGDDEVRVYRDGSFPSIGKEAGAKLLGPEQAGVALEVMFGNMSSSSDLAYYYGKYSDTRGPQPTPGHFLQIWQTNAEGAWKLVLDWQQPLPKP